MEKSLSRSLGGSLAVLTVAGFVLPRKHFLNLMNIDVNHSILRVPLTLALLYAGSTQSDLKTARNILLGVGIFYIAMGTAGMTDKKVADTLPSGLTSFDIVYHFVVGASAIWMGSRASRMMKP